MLEAVKQSDELAKIKNLAEFARAGSKNSSPRRTRSSKRSASCSTSSRKAEEKLLAEMQKRPGGNLPDDVRQKLEEARDKLNKFLKEQKKIIEASENLAKTPVEDFTEEQEQALKAMAAAGGRLGEVHEGVADRLEQAARAGFRQRLVAEGGGRSAGRAEDGRGRA